MNNKKTLVAWLFWLIVWQISAYVVDTAIFLPSPISVAHALFKLIQTTVFWKSIFFTFTRILMGFFLGVFIATIFAVLSYKSSFIETMLKPLMLAVKTIPVASFIILVLIWFSSKNLSILISFLMVLPIMYTNLLQGLKNTEKNLIEMAQVYKIGNFKKIRYIYIFEIYSYFKSGILVAMGLSFKSGIAAEVIGLPTNSIGEQIFNSKIYLDTVNLFAWTIIVIFLSLVFEKVTVLCFDKIISKLESV